MSMQELEQLAHQVCARVDLEQKCVDVCDESVFEVAVDPKGYSEGGIGKHVFGFVSLRNGTEFL